MYEKLQIVKKITILSVLVYYMISEKPFYMLNVSALIVYFLPASLLNLVKYTFRVASDLNFVKYTFQSASDLKVVQNQIPE
jgi:hypothetical protein